MDRESAVRDKAAALGFSACGFATVVPLPREAFLAGWLDAGCAAEMRYLERRPERRLHVGAILPEARTVITLAYPYRPPGPPAIDWRVELRGRIAAYALDDDYHDVLGRRLATFERFLGEAFPGCRTRRYVDTGAVLEREWAVRGGLGWFGKNTMLLSTRRGSWFFLAELVTDLVLTPDVASGSHCGRCTACLDACPTEALRDGLVLDARRCISYLTIEHRGAIPLALRPALGAWIFGCDVCQEVCPWNAPPAPDDARSAWQHPRLVEILALDAAGFRARFGRTPVTRAKRRGLLRNAAVALGNSGNPAAVPALVGALADPEPLVRAHAAWALGALDQAAARAALERTRGHDPDPTVHAEIESALERGAAPRPAVGPGPRPSP
jgi:epoxyqueuosine reductase